MADADVARIVKAITDLHAYNPVTLSCTECYSFEGNVDGWPCSTLEAVQAALAEISHG